MLLQIQKTAMELKNISERVGVRMLPDEKAELVLAASVLTREASGKEVYRISDLLRLGSKQLAQKINVGELRLEDVRMLETA